MELTPKTGIQTKNDNTESTKEPAPVVAVPVSTPVVPMAMPLPVFTENVIEPKRDEQLAVESERLPTLAQSSNQISNGLVNPAPAIPATRPNNRIALVGGDIILEEEEEEEEGEEEVTKETTEQSNMEPPALPAPAPPIAAPQRPTPVYVNASVLHQKKNPSYGQNINVIPDNKNSTKLLTKTKL